MGQLRSRDSRVWWRASRVAGFCYVTLVCALTFALITRPAPRASAEEKAGDEIVAAQAVANSLGGSVYLDANGNGSRDSSEAGIPGVFVTLSGATTTNTPVSQLTTTGPDGTYLFTNVAAGVYNLIETQPAGYTDGAESAGSLGGDTGTNDVIGGITFPAGAAGTGYNFGERQVAATNTPTPTNTVAGTASLAGTIYLDGDGDGIRDTTEAGIPNVTVQLSGLDTGGAAVTRTTTSGAGGTYSFTALPAGVYNLNETQPTGYTDGEATAGSLGGTAGTNTITGIVVPAGASGTGYDFGEGQGSAATPRASTTPSPSVTVSGTPSATPTGTRTVTPTGTLTVTPIGTLTATATPTRTPTPFSTATPTYTATAVVTATPSFTPTPVATATPTRIVATPTTPPTPTATATFGPPRALDFQMTNDKPGALAGETITFTILLRNPNAQPAANVIVTDDLPLGLALQGVTASGTMTISEGRLIFNIGTIPPNGTVAIGVTTKRVGGDGATINTASYTTLIDGRAFSGTALSGVGTPALPNTGSGDEARYAPALYAPMLPLIVSAGGLLLIGANVARRRR